MKTTGVKKRAHNATAIISPLIDIRNRRRSRTSGIAPTSTLASNDQLISIPGPTTLRSREARLQKLDPAIEAMP
jgi:hypothetical protein